MANEVLLQMKNITMTFPGVKALQNVDFTLCKGEIHALMGENGAGKSTLIKVLTGIHTRDSGEIFLEGNKINNHSPEESQQNGISTVYQEVNLCPNISVAENIFAGHEPKKHFAIDWKLMNEQAKKVLTEVGLVDIDVTKSLGDYSVAIQQMVAINDFKIRVEGHELVVVAETDGVLRLTSMDGKQRMLQVKAGEQRFTINQAGVYAIENRKIMIK